MSMSYRNTPASRTRRSSLGRSSLTLQHLPSETTYYDRDVPPFLQISSRDVVPIVTDEEADAAAGGSNSNGNNGNDGSSSNISVLKRVSSFSIISRVASTTNIATGGEDGSDGNNNSKNMQQNSETSNAATITPNPSTANNSMNGISTFDSSHSSVHYASNLTNKTASILGSPTLGSKASTSTTNADGRHRNATSGKQTPIPTTSSFNTSTTIPSWRLRDRMKTVGVGLVMALNVGTDPPDVIKPHPCAKLQCWMDPSSVTRAKAKEKIGERLEAQYARWQQQRAARPLKYRRALDPTVEDVRTLCLWLRRQARQERILLHYNGHGVPRPTSNGEIWVFDKNHTEYIPLSVSDLRQWTGKPTIVVLDCSSAGILIPYLTCPITETPPNTPPRPSPQNPVEQEQPPIDMDTAASHWVKDTIVLCPTSESEWLPMHPDYPADIFTSCLTTPIQMALRWFVRRNRHSMGTLNPEAVDAIPGQANDRKTPLGELNWIFTAVTDSIAWNVLPKPLFQRLFRQDLLVASLFRNFLVADRILRSLHCTPQSYPPLPPGIADHPLWQAWDLACETCLFGLIQDGILGNHVVKPPVAKGRGGNSSSSSSGGNGGSGDDPENGGGGGGGGSHEGTPPGAQLQQGQQQHNHMHPNNKQHPSLHHPNQQQQQQQPPNNNKKQKQQPLHPTSGPASSVSSPFFSEQLTAFEIWLEHAAIFKGNIDELESPEQLPVVLQVLLSQVHRIRALELLRRFLELGPWAVNLALSLGISPYVMKLLQSPEYKTLLVHIWASILCFDPTCQVDLVKDGAMPHFIQPLTNRNALESAKQRTLASFCLAATCYKYPQAQAECLRQNLHGHCCALLATYDKAQSELLQQQQLQQQQQQQQGNDNYNNNFNHINNSMGGIGPGGVPMGASPSLTQSHMLTATTRTWICLSIGNLVQAFPPAQRDAYNQNVHVCLLFRLKDEDPEVRAAASFALGCLLEHSPEAPQPSPPPNMSLGPQNALASGMPPPTFQPGGGVGLQPPPPGAAVQSFQGGGQPVLVPQHMSAATMSVPAALTASAVLSGQLRPTMAPNAGPPGMNLQPQPTNNPMWHPQQVAAANPPQQGGGGGLIPQPGPQLQPPRLQQGPRRMNPPQLQPPQLNPPQLQPPQMNPPQLQPPQMNPAQLQPPQLQLPQQGLMPQQHQLQPQLMPQGAAQQLRGGPMDNHRIIPGPQGIRLGGPQGMPVQGIPGQVMPGPGMPVQGMPGQPQQLLPQPLLHQQNLLRPQQHSGGPMMPQMMGRPLVGGDNPVPFMGGPMNPMMGPPGHPGLMMGMHPQQHVVGPPIPRRRPTVYEDRRRLELDLGIAEALVRVFSDGSALARYEALMAFGNFVSKYTQAFLLVAEEASSKSLPEGGDSQQQQQQKSTTNDGGGGGGSEEKKPVVAMPQGMNRQLVDRIGGCWKALRATQHKDAHPNVTKMANTIVSVVHEQLLDMRMEREKEEAKANEADVGLSGIDEEGELIDRVASEQNMSTPPPKNSTTPRTNNNGVRSDGPAHRLQPKGQTLRRTATDPDALSRVSNAHQDMNRFAMRSPQGVPPLLSPTDGGGDSSLSKQRDTKKYLLEKSQFYEWKKKSFKLRYDDMDDDDREDRDPLNPACATRAYQQRRDAIARETGVKLAKHFEGLKPKPPKRRKVDILLDSDEDGEDKDSSLKVELKLKESKLLQNTGVKMTSMLKFHAFEDILSVCDNEDKISIWDYEKGTRKMSFRNGNPKKSRMTTAFWINESSTSMFFVGCDDGSARVWNGIVESNGQVSNESPTLAAAFFALPAMDAGQRGSGLICEWQQQSGTLIAGGDSSSIRCWDLASEKCSRVLETETEACVTALTTAWDEEKGYSPAGYQGLGPNIIVAGHGDGTLKVFDIRAPNPAAALGGRRPRSNTFTEHQSWIVDTSFTSYGGRFEIVSGSVAGDIRAWDLRLSSSLRTLDVQRSPMTALAVHKQIPIAATGSQAQFIKIVTMEGETLQMARFHEEMPGQHRIGPVSCLEFHKHKLVLAAGASNSFVSIYKPKFPLRF